MLSYCETSNGGEQIGLAISAGNWSYIHSASWFPGDWCSNIEHWKDPENKQKENGNRKRLSQNIREKILKRDNYTCQNCGNRPDKSDLEIDHIIPVAIGGANNMSNLQVLCKSCNGKKSDKLEVTHE